VKVVPGSDLVAFGRKFLESNLARRGITIEITDPTTPRSPVLPDVPVEMKAEMSARQASGLVPVAVEVWAEGKREVRILLSYRVLSRGPVAQAVRDLAPGEIISMDDLVEAERDLAGLPDDAVKEASALAGLKVLRPVAAGSVIRKGAVAMPALVKRGGAVTLTARVGTVEARAMAQAKEDGANGAVVTVMNLGSRRLVKARVTGSETVEAVMP
jgi:flagella basal body P-ring formation protein FlgA